MTDQWAEMAISGPPDDEADGLIARAEDALGGFKPSFSHEARRQIARLDKAFRLLAAPNARAGGDGNLFPYFTEVFEAAHEIKGQAGTFGYDLLTHVCESLCCVVDSRRHLPDAGIAAIGDHIMAIKVIVERDLKGLGSDFGKALLRELGQLKTCIASAEESA